MYIYTYTSISRGEYSDKTKTSFTAASDAATATTYFQVNI